MAAPHITELVGNIQQDRDGLWISRRTSAVSYPDDGNDIFFSIEEKSFWFLHRNRALVKLLKAFPPAGVFFDIGGGNGFVAKGIQDAGYEVALVEPGSGARNALRRGIRTVIQGALQDLDVRPASLPAAGAFDVVEHIEDDKAFLAGLYDALQPGGRLYITVPALPVLWSQEDIDAGHYRRYTCDSLAAVLRRAGFEVEFVTYFFGFLTAPLFLLRVLPFRLGWKRAPQTAEEIRADHETQSPLTARILNWLCRREDRRLEARRPARFGTSCLAVARKPLQ